MHYPIALTAISNGQARVRPEAADPHHRGMPVLTAAARKHRVITQMGIQGHAQEGTRLCKEWLDAGAIGPVREVQLWTDRPIWPQGMPVRRTRHLHPHRWIGTCGSARPRAGPTTRLRAVQLARLVGFGCGALGDMGCHIMDAAFWAWIWARPRECRPKPRVQR